MTKLIIKSHIHKRLLTLFLALLCSFALTATEQNNHVIISGQVINMEYGNPVVSHTIHIESSASKGGLSNYYKTIQTNQEGYYFDTICTSEVKGALTIYTNDYNGKTIDTNVFFRFMDNENKLIIADFLIYMPYYSGKPQARFKCYQKQGDDKYKFNFIDKTIAENKISYHWNFGDGTISNIQNPTHTYQNSGLFKVVFTVNCLVDNEIVTSEISKQIYIGKRDFYHLGGHAFINNFPIDKGNAYLYMLDSADNYYSVDTVEFDTLGYYFFYHIPKGKYIVKVEPTCESQYYSVLLPTYYGDELFWQDCKIVDFTSTSWEYDINLILANGSSLGEGSISGNVAYEEMFMSVNNVSAQGVNIYLFDDFDNLLSCNYSDNNGDFGFDLVETNTYWIYPEITGISAEKIKVVLTNESPIVDNIEIKIQNGINSIFPNDDLVENNIVGLPYPNPANDVINISINAPNAVDVTYFIYDMYGKNIFSGKENMVSNSFKIHTDNINNGSYIIRTVINKDAYDRTFIIAK